MPSLARLFWAFHHNYQWIFKEHHLQNAPENWSWFEIILCLPDLLRFFSQEFQIRKVFSFQEFFTIFILSCLIKDIFKVIYDWIFQVFLEQIAIVILLIKLQLYSASLTIYVCLDKYKIPLGLFLYMFIGIIKSCS